MGLVLALALPVFAQSVNNEVVTVPDQVHIISLGGRLISRPLTTVDDPNDVAVYSGGVYAWQRRSKDNAFLEFRARDVVVFYARQNLLGGVAQNQADAENPKSEPLVEGLYLEGNVTFQVKTDKPGEEMKFSADRLYYDFVHERALVIDADIRLRMVDTGLPIHLKAKQVRQYSRTHFAVKNVALSNDEFYQPHVWLGAKSGDIFLDEASAGHQGFHYEFQDVTANIEHMPLFWWPHAAGGSKKTDTPLKRIHTSYDSQYGMSLESEWHLDWLTGRKAPPGVDAVLRLDEYTKRGPAIGANIDYLDPREGYYGRLLGYMVNDDGEDRLGRYEPLLDVEPTRNLRGRADWRHRQLLPYDWEATFEVSYLSDADFLEGWYEREFDTDKPQETSVYLRHSRDNWAFDFLNQFHLNDFEYTQTELPTAGFHLAGQDVLDCFSYYHDGYLSRIRERAGERDVAGLPGTTAIFNPLGIPFAGLPGYREPWILPGLIDEDDYAFAVSRHEVSLPLHFSGLHFAPTLIGTYVFDDSGNTNSFVQGAGGLRLSTQLWHVDDTVESRLWNLHRIRHVLVPEFSAFWIDGQDAESNPFSVFEHESPKTDARDVFNFALRQRWQTMRGPEGLQRSVDVLRWDTSLTLVPKDVDDVDLPQRFYFSTPEPLFGNTPLLNADLANLGLARREQLNQTLADFVTSRWAWQISDATALTGGVNINIHDGVLSHTDAGFAVQRTPRLSYYIGQHYFHNGDPFDEGRPVQSQDSHFLVGGLNYQINSKYSVVLGHQFDVQRTTGAYSQLVLFRKFVHWYGAFSIGHDSARGSTSFMLTFWPEGFDTFVFGSRRYAKMSQ